MTAHTASQRVKFVALCQRWKWLRIVGWQAEYVRVRVRLFSRPRGQKLAYEYDALIKCTYLDSSVLVPRSVDRKGPVFLSEIGTKNTTPSPGFRCCSSIAMGHEQAGRQCDKYRLHCLLEL